MSTRYEWAAQAASRRHDIVPPGQQGRTLIAKQRIGRDEEPGLRAVAAHEHDAARPPEDEFAAFAPARGSPAVRHKLRRAPEDRKLHDPCPLREGEPFAVGREGDLVAIVGAAHRRQRGIVEPR